MACIIKLIQLASGQTTKHDGQYLVKYTPLSYSGILVTTKDRSKAKVFPDAEAAFKVWKTQLGTRPDGQPNRPLTAWTIEIKNV